MTMVEEDADQACPPTKTCAHCCVGFTAWGSSIYAPLVKRGEFWCCPACGNSYGVNPHPDLAETPVTSANPDVFFYKGSIYPEYLKQGNACQYIAPTALKFCKGVGYDVGASHWPLPGAIPVTPPDGDAMSLPQSVKPGSLVVDFVFSSHCLEHLVDPVKAIEHWRTRLRPQGVLFLYLPHPAMEYWLPQNCRKHLHSWQPAEMAKIVANLGFHDVMHSERDLAWSFAVVGYKHD